MGTEAITATRKIGLAVGATAAAALAVVLVQSGFYFVPTDSMRPTLDAGDVVWCWRMMLSGIDRGDIVIFDAPNAVEKGIKRVVAMPTDSVRYMGKELTINGGVAAKKFKRRLSSTDSADVLFEQTLFQRSFDVIEMYGQSLSESASKGPGYFLMGDNRDASVDSRHYGRLAKDRIRCKALAVVATEVPGKFVSIGVRWL